MTSQEHREVAEELRAKGRADLALHHENLAKIIDARKTKH
jgi:hypothetical protein